MKKLSELGVSPAPWKWDGDEMTDDLVLSAGGSRVAEWMNDKDARLCAAAPDLYEALRDVYEDCLDPKYDGGRYSIPARAALEKAGGKE